MAALPRCKPYKIETPIQARKQWLVFDDPNDPAKSRLMTREGTITNVLEIMKF
jgi:hypothetical protein